MDYSLKALLADCVSNVESRTLRLQDIPAKETQLCEDDSFTDFWTKEGFIHTYTCFSPKYNFFKKEILPYNNVKRRIVLESNQATFLCDVKKKCFLDVFPHVFRLLAPL